MPPGFFLRGSFGCGLIGYYQWVGPLCFAFYRDRWLFGAFYTIRNSITFGFGPLFVKLAWRGRP